jgi:FG-GAP-like repeat
MFAEVISAGDVNGDGITDLVMLDSFGSPDTGVLLGKADGTFAPANVYSLGISGADLFLRDVNNDGKLDLVTDGGVALGRGDGTFAAVIPLPFSVFSNCAACQNVAVGDFNGDGKLDLLYSQTGVVHVMIGDGTGHFTEKSSITQCSCLSVVAAGDLNGDGKADMVVGVFGGGVATFLGAGNGAFQLVESDSISPTPSAIYGQQVVAITIRDMNGDGIPDVIVQTTAGMPIFLGKGAGKLTSAVYFAAPGGDFGTSAFAIADYNLDGTPDIVVPTYNGFARLLNIGYATWPRVSAVPPPSPF